ncbi:MAG: hypothetical protein NC203_00125 [Firmicutes bacterium]|nr:hypothetical protein [Bacillota bacterium]
MNLYSGRVKTRPYIMHEKMHCVGEGLDPIAGNLRKKNIHICQNVLK